MLLKLRKSGRSVGLQQLLKSKDLVGIKAFETRQQAGQQGGDVVRFVSVVAVVVVHGRVAVVVIVMVVHCSVDEVIGKDVVVDAIVVIRCCDQS